MKLISCYITGFGAIKEYSCDFDRGLNAICRENGWGKSTFSVFLKAMFYGMDYSARTRMLTERKHFLPWDGGICGGSLTFETEGKVYRVERSFGQTGKEDTFVLWNVDTGDISTDFTSNLGEEIFQVDRYSFEKTIFIPQSDISTTLTDSINAKMGNLATMQGDVNNFDAAVSRVAEARKSYTRKSKVNNGRLNVIREEISICSEAIDKKAAVLDGFEKQTALLEEKKHSLNWMEAEKDRLAEQIRIQSKKEQDTGAYRKQVEFLEKQQAELVRLDEFFAAGLPTEEEHAGMENVERQYDLAQRTQKDRMVKLPPRQQIEKWETLFENGIPSSEEMDSWSKKASHMQELRLQGKHAQLSDETVRQLEELKLFFSRKVPTDEELAEAEHNVIKLSRLEGRLVEQNDRYQRLKARKEAQDAEAKKARGFGGVLMLVLLGLALGFGGVAFWRLTDNGSTSIILEIICFAGAAVSLAAAAMQTVRLRSAYRNRDRDICLQMENARETLTQCEEERNAVADSCREFLMQFMQQPSGSMQQAVYEIRVNLEHYRHLLEEEKQATQNTTGAAEELAQVRLELFTALDHYAEVYQIDLYQHPGIETELLELLTKDVALYREYLEECRQKDQADKVMEEQRHLLDDYLKRFPIEATLSVAEGLKCVQTNRQRYGQLQEEISNQKKELRKFRRETQVEKNTVSVEELQVQQEKLDQEIREINRGITQDNETLLQLTEELDQIEDAEMRRDVLTEEKTDCLKKVDLLIKTEEFLQMAREQFLSSYMKPLRQGLDRYMSLLDDRYFDVTAAMDLDITMDLSIQIHSHGTTHSGEYLSRGYQDLAALCARFALVDVLYRKEQPVIILDDPLTNLDGDKVSRGLQLLQKISENRQIIYFTCHDSRMP